MKSNNDGEFDSEFDHDEVDPIVSEEAEEKTDEGIRNRLTALFHFTEDEMKVQFPDRVTLRAFYTDVLKTRSVKPMPDEVGKKDASPKDDYALPPETAREVDEKIAKREAYRAKRALREQQQGAKMLQNAGLEEPPLEQSSPASTAVFTPPKTLQDILGEDWHP